MKQTKLVLALAAAGMLVVGCGGGSSSTAGGGGGGGSTTTLSGTTKYGAVPTAAIKITPTNANTVTSSGTTAMNGLSSSGNAMSNVKATAQASNSAASIALREIQRARGMKFQAVPVGALGTTPTTTPCTTGSYTSSFTDKNANSAFDAGDSFSITFNTCTDGAGGSQNGGMSLSVSAMAGQDVTATITFTDLQSVSAGVTSALDGDITLATTGSGASASISGKRLSMNHVSAVADPLVDGIFEMVNYSFSMTNMNSPTTSSTTITMTTASTAAGGSITLTTPVPLTDTAGSFRFTGASGSYVELSSVDGGINCNQTIFDGTTTTGPTTGTCASFGL